jgi:hypothetical protein
MARARPNESYMQNCLQTDGFDPNSQEIKDASTNTSTAAAEPATPASDGPTRWPRTDQGAGRSALCCWPTQRGRECTVGEAHRRRSRDTDSRPVPFG